MPLGSLWVSGPIRRFVSPNDPTLKSQSGRAASAWRFPATNAFASGGQQLVIDRCAEHDRVVGVERLDLVDQAHVDGCSGIDEARGDAGCDFRGRSMAAGVDDQQRHDSRILVRERACIGSNPQHRSGISIHRNRDHRSSLRGTFRITGAGAARTQTRRGSYLRLWLFASPLEIEEMELAGLEPATSWVRSLSGEDSRGRNGMNKPSSASAVPLDSPLSPPLLTTDSPRRRTAVRCR